MKDQGSIKNQQEKKYKKIQNLSRLISKLINLWYNRRKMIKVQSPYVISTPTNDIC